MKTINYIDLFAGAGGLSEGFIRQGFRSVAHVEYDKAACFTLKTRLAYHYLHQTGNASIYYDYLRGDITRKELYKEVPQQIIDTVINAEIGKDNEYIFNRIDNFLIREKVDMIIGGPPCQAYSVVGRAPLKHKKNDVRTKLYIHYGRFLKKYKPKVFVFENVPGILSAENGKYYRNLKKYYKGLGYEVEYRLMNSCDYGVIQNRRRIIIVGWQKDLHFQYPELKPVKYKYFRDDIFKDLPSINPGETKRVQEYAGETNTYLNKNAIRNGIDFVTQHITRSHNENDLTIYKLAIQQLETGKRLRNNQIPEYMRTQNNTTDFLDRFKVVDKEPHTMIAHIAKDGHHFIHPDKKQLRSLSVREAARIQSFPDDYYFEGIKERQPRTAAFRQIGNAVPPLMAEKIAERLKELLNE